MHCSKARDTVDRAIKKHEMKNAEGSHMGTLGAAIFVDGTHIKASVQEYLEKQSMRRTPDLQKEEPSISSPPIDLIASALADFRG